MQFRESFLEELFAFFESVQPDVSTDDHIKTVLQFTEIFGGQQIYIPNAEKTRCQIRNSQIIQEYEAGTTPVFLGKKYKLSTQRVRQIIWDHTNEDKRQLDFEFDHQKKI